MPTDNTNTAPPTITARVAIRVDGVVDFTAEVNAREIDWSASAPLRYLRLTAAALKEMVRLNLAWWYGEKGGRRANLQGADLQGAYLQGAYLRRANLQGADLQGAYLPSPTVVLLAAWGALSAALTADLMRYDAASHPDPAAFDRWAAGGDCPYSGVTVERAAIFDENRALWSPGPCPRPYDLMVAVLAEKCPDWTEEQRAAFEEGFAVRRDAAKKASKETL